MACRVCAPTTFLKALLMSQDVELMPKDNDNGSKAASAPSDGGREADQGHHPKSKLPTLVVGAIGVVFGDIGTSPLYALRESLSHSVKADALTQDAVIGALSLLIFALIFTVTLKYVLFLMRADNRGEGGILSLMALAHGALGQRGLYVFLLGAGGAALFSGDAIITPAVSVMSALEGLELVTSKFSHYVIPATIAILVTLFWVQKHGTARVATFFGPIMILFFLVIGWLGATHIPEAPQVLSAFNPINGLSFLAQNGWLGVVILGSVFLGVTGAEALYADMGHFGRQPIQIAWIAFILPALLLNYLGQGALILSHPESVNNPFFNLAPEWALLPLVILATVATVIASQSVITGAFSLVRQAIQLGLLPRLEITHTSEAQEGQIYVGRVNRLLLIGVIVLVITFRNSSALASAYGIAVTGTMVVTTALAFVIVRHRWRWPLWASVLFIGAFLIVDLAFLAANLLKVMEGGWVPLVLGACSMVIMWTWVRGSRLLTEKTHRDSIPLQDLIVLLRKSGTVRVPGTAVFLTADPNLAPVALMHNIKHNKVLHERILVVCVRTENTPRVNPARRFQLEQLTDGFNRATFHFGYMESPRVPVALAAMRKAGFRYDIMTTSFFLGRRTVQESASSEMPAWQDKLFVALTKQSANATDFFSIPADRAVELGARVTI
jgi:KUP system potassium uptake protein